MKNWIWLSLVLMASLALVACADDADSTANDTELGEPVPEFRILTSLPEENQENHESAGVISEEWEELGMDVSVESMEFNTLLDILDGEEEDYEAFMIGWGGRVDRIDPDMFLYSIFHSSNAIPGGNNMTNYQNEDYDRLAEDLRREMDPDTRQQIAFEAQEMLAEEVPLITLYARDLVHAYNHERFDNMTVMAGEGIFNEWMPMEAQPLDEDDQWLRIGTHYDLDTLNPLSANSTYEWRNLRLIYDKLVRLSPDAEPQPAAAESWEVIDDTTVDVDVRAGMTFHDGEPVTAEDVAFTYDFFIDWEVPYFLSFTDPIESVELVDDETVRFHLHEPYAPFVNVTLAQIPILPQHIWENVVDEEGLGHPDEFTNDEAIGSGPFELDHWRRGEELQASTFDDFYEDIAIDGYLLDIHAQAEAVMASLETGDVDVNSEQFIPAHIQQAQELEHLTVQEVPDIGYQFLSFNTNKAPFDDVAFRQALAHTVDQELIVEAFLQGYADTGGAGYVITEANEFWHNPDVERPDYDPDMARQVLEEAGYGWDDEGVLHMPADSSAE